jgi:hypothetical protein
MTDFLIVVVATAALASPASIVERDGAAVPMNAPTVGFKVYKGATSCEEAMSRLAAPPGKRFVCVPVGDNDQELAAAY